MLVVALDEVAPCGLVAHIPDPTRSQVEGWCFRVATVWSVGGHVVRRG